MDETKVTFETLEPNYNRFCDYVHEIMGLVKHSYKGFGIDE